MKKSMLILAVVFGISTSVFAQTNVPERVQNSFKKDYANAKGVEWKEKDGMYQAKFEENNTMHWVDYNADGTVKMKGHEIPVTDLPAAVSSAIEKAHPNHTIDKASVVEENGHMMYSARLNGEDEDMKMMYNADGTVAKAKTQHIGMHKANKSGMHNEKKTGEHHKKTGEHHKKPMHTQKKKSGM